MQMAPKNWDKIAKESLEEDEEKSSMDVFFKNIYANATEEQKRAMVKSFQTSGGSVLSTNWDEVAKADYNGKDRPEAPPGQEWRK